MLTAFSKVGAIPKRSRSADPIMVKQSASKRDELATAEWQLKAVDNEPQEAPCNYRVGGFMNISLGQNIEGFTVVRKLGYGAFSTVWFGKKLVGEEEEFRALKVGKSADICQYILANEVHLLEMMRDKDKEHAGYPFIMKLINSFELMSPHGLHTVMVLENIGYSLYDVIQEAAGRGVIAPASRNIVTQILLGMTYLHDKCNLIHTDIKPSNVIVTGNKKYLFEVMEKVHAYQRYGAVIPRSYVSAIEYIERQVFMPEENGSDGASQSSSGVNITRRPVTASILTFFERQSENMEPNIPRPLFISPHLHIQITDFGNAQHRKEKNVGKIQTPLYRSLEVYLDESFDFSADMWGVGCIAFELMAGELLFCQREVARGPHAHIRLMYQLCKGKVPSYMRKKTKNGKKFFNPDGKLSKYADEMLLMDSPRDILVKYMGWPKKRAEIFGNFLSECLNPDPKKRLTPTKGLNHRWLKEDWI